MTEFADKQLQAERDYLAPDGSEIRELARTERGSLAHCILPLGGVTKSVKHKTIDEIWYFVQGLGQVWRKQGAKEEVVDVRPGFSLTIPVGAHFQFRNTSQEPLCFVITSIPPWPKDREEAVEVGNGRWPI